MSLRYVSSRSRHSIWFFSRHAVTWCEFLMQLYLVGCERGCANYCSSIALSYLKLVLLLWSRWKTSTHSQIDSIITFQFLLLFSALSSFVCLLLSCNSNFFSSHSHLVGTNNIISIRSLRAASWWPLSTVKVSLFSIRWRWFATNMYSIALLFGRGVLIMAKLHNVNSRTNTTIGTDCERRLAPDSGPGITECKCGMKREKERGRAVVYRFLWFRCENCHQASGIGWPVLEVTISGKLKHSLRTSI